jgi:hypothetical protein
MNIMTHYTKWNSNSKDGKKLVSMLSKGMIVSDAKPGEVRSSVPDFKKYKPTSFRAAFYRLRDQYGVASKGTSSGDGVANDKCMYCTKNVFFMCL